MISGCRSSVDARPPLRATFDSLYRRPDSDEAFLRSVIRSSVRRSSSSSSSKGSPSVVDSSYSCRQMYLRSYTFTTAKKKESVPEKTKRCLGKIRDGAAAVGLRKKEGCVATAGRKMKEASRVVVSSIFGRVFSCGKQR